MRAVNRLIWSIYTIWTVRGVQHIEEQTRIITLKHSSAQFEIILGNGRTSASVVSVVFAQLVYNGYVNTGI